MHGPMASARRRHIFSGYHALQVGGCLASSLFQSRPHHQSVDAGRNSHRHLRTRPALENQEALAPGFQPGQPGGQRTG